MILQDTEYVKMRRRAIRSSSSRARGGGGRDSDEVATLKHWQGVDNRNIPKYITLVYTSTEDPRIFVRLASQN